MSNIFFTSDTHFGHYNAIQHCKRPFSSVEEMDEALISRWNEDVGAKDIVYHLGDFKFSSKQKVSYYLDRLDGRVILIRGNHDHNLKAWELQLFNEVHDMLEIKQLNLFLCHYAMRVWPKKHYGARHLFGHSHGSIEASPDSFDVGVDSHNYFVWSLDEVLSQFERLV